MMPSRSAVWGTIALVSIIVIAAAETSTHSAGSGSMLGAAQAGDRLAGTWTLNVARSSYGAAAPPRSQTTALHAMDGGLHEIVDRVNADGSMTHWEVAAKYDGKDYPVTGDPRATRAPTNEDKLHRQRKPIAPTSVRSNRTDKGQTDRTDKRKVDRTDERQNDPLIAISSSTDRRARPADGAAPFRSGRSQ